MKPPAEHAEKRRWRRKGLPSGAIAVLLGCALVIAGTWVITLERLAYERSEAIADTVRSNSNLALAFEAQTLHSLRNAENTLQHIKSVYEREGRVVDPRELAAERGIDEALVPNFLVTNMRGNVLLANGQAGPVSVADRDFFDLHRSSPGRLLRISKPITGRLTGKAVISLSRALRTPDGIFGGIVAVALDPNYFLESYKSLDLQRDGLIQLVGLDGVVRAGRAGDKVSFGEDLRDSTLLKLAAANAAGSFESRAPPDGVAKLQSFRVLGNYPLVVSVGTSVDVALEQFRSRERSYYLGAGALTLIILLSGALLAVSLQRRKLAMEAALRATRRYQATFDQAAVGVAHASCEGRFLKVNRKLCELLGYTEAELMALAWPDVTHAQDARLAADWVRRMAADPELSVPEFEKRCRRKDGSELSGMTSMALVRDSEGRPDYVVTVLQDISARKHAEQKVRRLNRVYAVLSGINTLIVRIKDREELFREACRIAVEAGQFRLAWIGVINEPAGRIDMVASFGDERGYAGLARPAAGASPAGHAGMSATAIATRMPVICNDIAADSGVMRHPREALERGYRSAVALPLGSGDACLGALALCADETGFFDDEEMKLLNELAGDISFALEHIGRSEKLEYLASYDSLTGLANRALFHERLDQRIDTAGREGGKLAVLLIDIERFRSINETLGRAAGDELLVQIAARARGYVKDASRLARFGTDYFAYVVAGHPDSDELLQRVGRSFREIFGAPFQLGDTALRVSGRCGIALFPADGSDADNLTRNAEAALKKAKASGEKYLFYARKMTERASENLTLENKLRQAIEKEEFVLHYQPKVSLETGAIAGVEALIRWQSPELGLVPPMKFIPLLEETGLILEAGAWALRQAAADHRGWVEQRLQAPRVAVNVSAIQLRQRDFVRSVEQAILNGIAPTGIDLEITESLIMQDIEATIAKLESVRQLGVGIAIDDFGTGYSSLAYLAKLPVAVLKIDRSFVITMLNDPKTMTLVQTMISLAHSLRLKVVAEGVDSEEQAKVLRLLRCDQMQGYLFSRPLPLAGMTALLRNDVFALETA